jgi:transposase
MSKKYVVELSKPEEEMLNGLISAGMQRVRKVAHAHILIKAHEGWADQQISQAIKVSVPTIERVRQRFVEEGIEQALTPRQTRRKYSYLLDGSQEAHLIALACGQPPAGHRRWSLRLLASQMVKLEYADEISHETVRHVMAENELKPWLKKVMITSITEKAALICSCSSPHCKIGVTSKPQSGERK